MKSVVYNRDCLEAMREMPSSSIGYVITSPPYNLSQCDGYKTLRAGHKGSSWKNGHKLAGGYDEWNDAMLARHVAQGNLFIPSEPIAEQGSLLG